MTRTPCDYRKLEFMKPEYTREAALRLKVAAGHLDSVRRVVDNDAYCIDLMKQLSAVQTLTRRSGHNELGRLGRPGWVFRAAAPRQPVLVWAAKGCGTPRRPSDQAV
jgi:hypothetical protein